MIRNEIETYLNAAETAYNKVEGNVKIICYALTLLYLASLTHIGVYLIFQYEQG